MIFHYIERPKIIALTRQLTLESPETIARLSANIRHLYLILNNVCRDPRAYNTPRDRVRRETRRLVSYCKYARHPAASEPKIALSYQYACNERAWSSPVRDFSLSENDGKDIRFYLLFSRHIYIIPSDFTQNFTQR